MSVPSLVDRLSISNPASPTTGTTSWSLRLGLRHPRRSRPGIPAARQSARRAALPMCESGRRCAVPAADTYHPRRRPGHGREGDTATEQPKIFKARKPSTC
jgi:hypothetical protein